MKERVELAADEKIGYIINEYGEIIRAGGEDIQFQAPIFEPNEEVGELPVFSAPEKEDVSVSFRVVKEAGREKSVEGVSSIDLARLREQLETER